ncbi:AAA ATPase [Entomortierella chlamydospora]|uniref:AAA ATPase n=1 Tax=Entomortierella chlamydospora TaxID=101097 RepID=A0A9P6MM72_9FUNG|nr:AAA ATPase [Entomortierella chlamydospora]
MPKLNLSVSAWPFTPTKKFLGATLKHSRVPTAPNFKNLDSDEENAPVCCPKGKINGLSIQVGLKNIATNPGEQIQTITPPMTPTRRSPRKPSKAINTTDTENFNSQQLNQRLLSTPPKRKPAGPLAPLTPCNSPIAINCNNTTGLTPAMKRILKPSKEFTSDRVESLVQGYSTPVRLPHRNRSFTTTSASCPGEVARPTFMRTLSSSSGTSDSSLSASSLTRTTIELYQDAKTLFRRTTEPYRLIGRAAERESIRLFCQNHMLTPKAGSLYISGQPGTGKTALLKEIVRDLEPEMKKAPHDIRVVVINCMTIKDPRLVFKRMLEALGHAAGSNDKDADIKAVESLVLDDKKKIIVTVLDEIDHLLTKDQDVLYRLFQWSCAENSKLTLIGIANALDMTDRFLPRLKAKSCEPQLLNFNPYQVSEIKEIIMDRLFSLNGNTLKGESENGNNAKSNRPKIVPLMQQPAIELCARKVAAATGDLRKALDICRHTIEMVEAEIKKEKRKTEQEEALSIKRTKIMPLQEISLADLENRIAGGVKVPIMRPRAVTSLPSSPVLSPTLTASPSFSDELSPFNEGVAIQHVPKVTVEHVKKALISAFGSPIIQKMKALNLHQKIVLAVLVMKSRAITIADCEVGKVYEQYAAVCRGSNKIGAVNRSECQDLINMLEAGGLVTLSKAKEERLRRLNLVPTEVEVQEAIKGHDIIEAILVKAGF